MLGFGSLGYGQLPSPDQRTRLDPGAIEPGQARFGNVMFGGPAFPPIPTPAPTPPPVSADAPSGGRHHYYPGPRIRTAEEVYEERVRLGIIPPPVQKVVAKAARRVIARAKQQDASTTAPDPIRWLEEHQAQQRAILAADLRKQRIEADTAAQRMYMLLLALEVEAQIFRLIEQDKEDEQIVMLLMEM